MIRTPRRPPSETRRARRGRLAARRRSRSLAPWFEGLEERVVMSTITWNTTAAPTGGDWDTPGNWNRRRLPTAARYRRDQPDRSGDGDP